MAIDPAKVIAALEAEYVKALDDLSQLPPYDVSDQGRSISAGGARQSLQARLTELEKQLARYGQPVAGGMGPFVIRHRV